jgi:hypothetical protein
VRAVACVSVGIRFEDLLDGGWRETLEADDEHAAVLLIVRVCRIALVSVIVVFSLLLL